MFNAFLLNISVNFFNNNNNKRPNDHKPLKGTEILRQNIMIFHYFSLGFSPVQSTKGLLPNSLMPRFIKY